MIASKLAALALSALLTPAGGYGGHLHHGRAARFTVGAAVQSISPPLAGQAPGGDPARCDPTGTFNGPRPFAWIEPYRDLNGNGHFDSGEPYRDCNGNGRWDGNLLGGGGNTPRYYDKVADSVDARAMVVGNGRRRIAVEVLDQEGLFGFYQQQIRDRVRADGVRLDGIFISANHDESAPDSLGLGGVTQTTSGVNDYWTRYMVAQAARAIEVAARRARPAHLRMTEVLEPANFRQCWSSYPYVDDQHMPVLQAVDRRGRTIATLVDVSQHVETLGFNGGTPSLDAQNRWVSSDWVHFFRSRLEQRLGGTAIEMAGSVGSVESPEVYPAAISRLPQHLIAADHPAGCHTLFGVRGQDDKRGAQHVPLGYYGETQAFGRQLATPVIRALRSGAYFNSASSTLWGERRDVCIPMQNFLFQAGAALGVFAHRVGYNLDCTVANPVLPNGSTSGQSILSSAAAFQIGDAGFLSVPGEVFPFTFLRGFQGPQDMPDPSKGMPPWPLPHLHTRLRAIDGLAEDMIGYIFPSGNAVGVPTAANLNPSDHDRFACNHSDDSEAASGTSGDLVGAALVGILDRRYGRSEKVLQGRYVLQGGQLSRDPLGGPELKCSVQSTFQPAGGAVAVALADGRRVRPRAWMSLGGLPQRRPDRDTRGYFDARGHRVWLDVYPELALR